MSFLRLAVLATVLLCLPAAAETPAPAREQLVVTAAGTPHLFEVEIADEPQERARGLMFRRQMANEHGMLFDFGEEEPASFWMENTYIPLDMLFIRGDGTVESIAERTTPLSRRGVTSKGPVRFVLEINGGLSDLLGIRPGAKVTGPAIETRQ